MLRCALAILALLTLVCASLIPEDALARRGGGFRGGDGFHGGAVRGGGRAHVSRPIARPGARAVARGGVYRGAAYRGYRRGVYGAAAVGAAAAGAAYYGSGYYNRGCYQDGYGNWVCPNQYQYRY